MTFGDLVTYKNKRKKKNKQSKFVSIAEDVLTIRLQYFGTRPPEIYHISKDDDMSLLPASLKIEIISITRGNKIVSSENFYICLSINNIFHQFRNDGTEINPPIFGRTIADYVPFCRGYCNNYIRYGGFINIK